MPRNIAQKKVIDAVLLGIKNAYAKYEAYSGYGLQEAPEYFVTCQVADALYEMDGAKGILLEPNVDLIMKIAGATGPGRPRFSTRKKGRTDIVLFYDNATPRAIIEIKSPLLHMTESAANDIQRINDMLIKNAQGSSFQFGMLAFYSYATKQLENKLDTILTHAKENSFECHVELVGKNGIVSTATESWVAAGLVITPP